MKPKFTLLALMLASGIALAAPGGIGSLSITPSPAKAGQAVTVTLTAEGDAPALCGLGIDYGDGNSDNIKINGRPHKFPLTLTHTYAKAGNYTLKAEGKKVTTHFPCLGSASVALAIESSDAAGVSVCPEGYKPEGKPAKSGAFTCKAGKGAKAPEKVLGCGDDLEYFQTKSKLGCRKAR
jgi:hypothetical protein